MRKYLVFMLVFVAGISLLAQSNPLPATPDCDPQAVQSQVSAFAQALTLDFATQAESSRDNLFRLGAVYQDLAVRCGYQPSEQEINALIQLTLSLTDLQTIIAANAVGDDIEAILAELENVSGDSFAGQLLYNGIEMGLDGTGLGCLGCHNGQTAPLTEGTWTRTNDIRLQDPYLAGYDLRRYLVESIVHPSAYVVPTYLPNLMPPNYGSRLDIQQLADLVAFLESQDQELE